MSTQPTIRVSESLGRRMAEEVGKIPPAEIERSAPTGIHLTETLHPDWAAFSLELRELFVREDHVIVRGLPVLDEGGMLIVTMATLVPRFMTYGEAENVVKVIAMNPWSRDLARSAAEGFFHSDLNASPNPPAVTGWQCVRPDPGAPDYGVNRIARAVDLLEALRRKGEHDVVRFICDEPVAMANDRSAGIWVGRIFEAGRIRFHVETIRAACRREGREPPEDMLHKIQQAAMEVSSPILLQEGDMLILSNHRTLHYRGECSVVFRKFPCDFIARKIYLAHGLDA